MNYAVYNAWSETRKKLLLENYCWKIERNFTEICKYYLFTAAVFGQLTE